MYNPIDFIRRDSGSHSLEALVQDFSTEFACHSQALDLFVVQLTDIGVSFEFLLGNRITLWMVGIVRPRYVIRYNPCVTLFGRPQFSGKNVTGPRIVRAIWLATT